jgi:hypothetical protein
MEDGSYKILGSNRQLLGYVRVSVQGARHQNVNKTRHALDVGLNCS